MSVFCLLFGKALHDVSSHFSVPSPMLVQPHGASGSASDILHAFLPQDLCTCWALYLQYPSPSDPHGSLLHILYIFAKGYLLSQAYPVSLFKTEAKGLPWQSSS